MIACPLPMLAASSHKKAPLIRFEDNALHDADSV